MKLLFVSVILVAWSQVIVYAAPFDNGLRVTSAEKRQLADRINQVKERVRLARSAKADPDVHLSALRASANEIIDIFDELKRIARDPGYANNATQVEVEESENGAEVEEEEANGTEEPEANGIEENGATEEPEGPPPKFNFSFVFPTVEEDSMPTIPTSISIGNLLREFHRLLDSPAGSFLAREGELEDLLEFLLEAVSKVRDYFDELREEHGEYMKDMVIF
ncbi:uncharacterized protein [Ptychodera flava]|uniref:uncharacterized protein n=1 Tax=Ptychodera flava TaxID=63121 RepID=UPI00396A71DD